MTTENNRNNHFLTDSLIRVYLKTATPMIFMMLVNGSFNLVDAYFLGVFVGADALTAVTSMFPLIMMIIALTTLVGTGFASVMGRQLGAGEIDKARQTFAQAISLSLIICLGLVIGFMLSGPTLTHAATGGSPDLARMSLQYMNIVIIGSPLVFILHIQGDAMRSEGHAQLMASVSFVTVALNVVANYIFIAKLNMGVAGSAYGTLAAQAMALFGIFLFRRSKKSNIIRAVIPLTVKRHHWKEILSLGAPSSLSYIGLALSSAAVLTNLQLINMQDYATTVSAYGILTRLMGFIFLPLLGLSLAFQSITGHNVGAGLFARSNRSIKIAVTSALIYCLSIQTLLWTMKNYIGSWFVDDAAVVVEVSRILPVMTLAFFLLGPLMIISMYFQSIGDAKRAAILSLSKPFLFALPLIFILPKWFGETGIWYAGPVAELCGLILTATVLYFRAKEANSAFGLFHATVKA